MIQINDPKMLRKDILESLREVIIFMQSYEKFRKIQEEKISLFSSLKTSVKELNSLIDNKLRSYLPKGKLRPVMDNRPEAESSTEIAKEQEIPPAKKVIKPEPKKEPEEEYKPRDTLEELETQLSDIEAQLKRMD